MNIWLNRMGEHNILSEHKSFTEFTRVGRSIAEVPLKLSGDFVFIILKLYIKSIDQLFLYQTTVLTLNIYPLVIKTGALKTKVIISF